MLYKPPFFCIFFSEERIRNGAKKLEKARHGSTQGRLDGFFKVLGTTSAKRKVSAGVDVITVWKHVGVHTFQQFIL